MTEEVTISAASPVVDTKKTTTGATFTADILEKIPTARDPWQIINMTPGVQAGLNVGGSSSGQQVGLTSRGTGANVQWNLEGGSITDLSSNSSPSYFNFDSFERNPGDQRRRRRLRAVVGPVDQPGDQERQQRVQGLRGRHVRERHDAGQQRHRRSCSTPARTASCRATRSRRSPTTRSSTAVRSSRTGCGSGARPTSRTSTPASSTSSTRGDGAVLPAT